MVSIFDDSAVFKENVFLREVDAARIIGFSVRTVQQWRFQHIGPPFHRISRRAVRYLLSDLIAWMRSQDRIAFASSPEQPKGFNPAPASPAPGDPAINAPAVPVKRPRGRPRKTPVTG